MTWYFACNFAHVVSSFAHGACQWSKRRWRWTRNARKAGRSSQFILIRSSTAAVDVLREREWEWEREKKKRKIVRLYSCDECNATSQLERERDNKNKNNTKKKKILLFAVVLTWGGCKSTGSATVDVLRDWERWNEKGKEEGKLFSYFCVACGQCDNKRTKWTHKKQLTLCNLCFLLQFETGLEDTCYKCSVIDWLVSIPVGTKHMVPLP